MTFSGMRELNSGVLCFDKFLRKQWQCLKLFFPFKAYWVFASSRYDICEKRLGGCPRPVAVSSTMLCTAGHRSSNNQILKYCNMTFFFFQSFLSVIWKACIDQLKLEYFFLVSEAVLSLPILKHWKKPHYKIYTISSCMFYRNNFWMPRSWICE